MRATRLAIALFFFGDGLMIGSWAGRIPAVQHHAGLTTARLGLALFAASLGAPWRCRSRGSCASESAAAASRSPACFSAAARCSPRRSRPVSPGSPRRCSLSARASVRSTSPPTRRAWRSNGSSAVRSSRPSTRCSRPAASSAPERQPSLQQRISASSCTTPCRPRPHRVRARGRAACSRPRPTIGSRRGEAQRLRAATAGDRRARRGGVLHDARRGCGCRLERSLPVALVRRRSRRGSARLHRFAFMMMTSRPLGDRLNRRLGAVTLARTGARGGDARTRPRARDRVGARRDRRLRRDGSGPRRCRSGAFAAPRRPRPSRPASGSPPSRRSAGSASSQAAGNRVRGLGRRPAAALRIVVLATLTLVALAGNAEPGRRRERVAPVRVADGSLSA